MMLLEQGDSAIAVDCGLMFPGPDLLGIDLVIPDVSYLLEKKKNLHGIVLTHAHEDHIGALPYILKQLPVPVFGTRLTLGLLRYKLREHGLERSADLREITAARPWELGPFKIEGIRVTHSLMDCLALAIESPLGTVLHTGDFKIDHTPVNGEFFDFQRFASYGEKGVLLLLSDSTNVERQGYTPSERVVGQYLKEIFLASRGRIFVATFSSNIPRIQQVTELSESFGRRVVLCGRSMINNAQIASDLGYLRLPEGVMTESDRWQDFPSDRLTFLTTGSQGEPMSALFRMATDEHKQIQIKPGDTVILSARVIPGNEKDISRVINHLFRKGARVLHERIAPVHVSGHASQEEQKKMLEWTRPRFFIPIHGEYRQLVSHAALARETGVGPDRISIVEDGEELLLSPDRCEKGASRPAGKVYIDGNGVGDVETSTLKERRRLGSDGMIIVTLALEKEGGKIRSGPTILSQGFSFIDSEHPFWEEMEQTVENLFRQWDAESNGTPEGTLDGKEEIETQIRRTLKKMISKKMNRYPVIVPNVILI